MSSHAILLSAALMLPGCNPSPAESDTQKEEADTSAEEDILTSEELDALATWTTGSVSVSLSDDGPAVTGDRISILLEEGAIRHLDMTTALNRAQDHNNSRSNKSGIVWVDDDLGEDDESRLLSISWDGREACMELPCPSSSRPEGAVSSLTIAPGDSLSDDLLAVTWGETTPMEEEFSGYLSLGCSGCQDGHVTVLKAAATDGGGIEISSALGSKYMSVSDVGKTVYEGQPTGHRIAFVDGNTGASWPKGLSVDETAIGTLISLTW